MHAWGQQSQDLRWTLALPYLSLHQRALSIPHQASQASIPHSASQASIPHRASIPHWGSQASIPHLASIPHRVSPQLVDDSEKERPNKN